MSSLGLTHQISLPGEPQPPPARLHPQRVLQHGRRRLQLAQRLPPHGVAGRAGGLPAAGGAAAHAAAAVRGAAAAVPAAAAPAAARAASEGKDHGIWSYIQDGERWRNVPWLNTSIHPTQPRLSAPNANLTGQSFSTVINDSFKW